MNGLPLDADTSVSVVEMADFEFDIACEGNAHGEVSWHGGPNDSATHYVKFSCIACGYEIVTARCYRYVKILCFTKSRTISCTVCKVRYRNSADTLTILGSVKV